MLRGVPRRVITHAYARLMSGSEADARRDVREQILLLLTGEVRPTAIVESLRGKYTPGAVSAGMLDLLESKTIELTLQRRLRRVPAGDPAAMVGDGAR